MKIKLIILTYKDVFLNHCIDLVVVINDSLWSGKWYKKTAFPKLIRHCLVQAQSDWLYEVTITHLSITIIMTLHHITFDRCIELLIPANLMTSNLWFGELLLSVGKCSRFAETRIVAYHFNFWTQLPSITTGSRHHWLLEMDGSFRNWSFVLPSIIWRYSHCDNWVKSAVLSIILQTMFCKYHNLQFCDFDSCYYFMSNTLIFCQFFYCTFIYELTFILCLSNCVLQIRFPWIRYWGRNLHQEMLWISSAL